MNRHGGTEPHDFLMMAIDGLQARLDGFQEQIDAIRTSVEKMLAAPAPPSSRARLALAAPAFDTDSQGARITRAALAALAENNEKGKKISARWTPERRAKASRLMRKRSKAMWAAKQAAAPAKQAAAPAKKPTKQLDRRGRPFTPGARGWTPEAKARLSASMKRAHRAKQGTWKQKPKAAAPAAPPPAAE